MDKRIDILTELQQLSPVVAAIEQKNTYSVPAGYFDHLPQQVLAVVNAEAPAAFTSQLPYSVPSGYFDGLSSQVMARIKATELNEVDAELRELSPLLSSLSRKNVYTVPDGYFSSFSVPKSRLDQLMKEPATKPVLLKPVHSFYRYAIAAIVTAVVAFGGYFFSQDNNGTRNLTAGSIINYDSAKKMNVDSEIATVNATDIETFLDASPAVMDLSFSAPDDADININQVIDNADQDELEHYLNSSPSGNEKSFKEI